LGIKKTQIIINFKVEQEVQETDKEELIKKIHEIICVQMSNGISSIRNSFNINVNKFAYIGWYEINVIR